MTFFTNVMAQDYETVYLKDGSKIKGYIAEQTPGKSIGFIQENSEEPIVVKWEDISYIEQDKLPTTLLSGINSVVTLKNDDVITGRIIEIYPGSKIRIDNGTEERVCDFSYIDNITKVVINENQPFEEQAYYLDVVYLKNNNKVKGFITKQIIGKSITVLDNKKKIQNIELKDIVSLKREKNDDYKPVLDIVLTPGQYMCDGINVKFQNLEPINSIYFVDVNGNMIKTGVDQEVIICANMIDKNANVLATKTLHQTEKKNLIGSKKLEYETFTNDDFLKSSLVVEKSAVSKNGTTKLSFTPKEKGYYVLRINGVTGFIVIHAK